MRKNILSLSIAAMIGGLGLAGGASAAVFTKNTTTATATSMVIDGTGIGHQLIVPYFNTQNGNVTNINLVNTDSANGKLVKIRFRGASNSDDLLDFQVFLSPSDVWTASVSKNPTTGVSQLTTNDNSCTLPLAMKGAVIPFGTGRLNPALKDDALAAETREGYIEIINTANIPKAGLRGQATGVLAAATNYVAENPLYTAIKHVAGTAPCTAAPLNATLVDPLIAVSASVNSLGNAANVAPAATERAASTLGLDSPTGLLFANATIVNVPNTTTFPSEAVALRAVLNGANAPANLIHFPQADKDSGGTNLFTTAGAVTSIGELGKVVGVDGVIADPLFKKATNTVKQATSATAVQTVGASGTTPTTLPIITAFYVDMPDLSTPYLVLPAALNNAAANAAAAATAANAAATAGAVADAMGAAAAAGGDAAAVAAAGVAAGAAAGVAINAAAAGAVANVAAITAKTYNDLPLAHVAHVTKLLSATSVNNEILGNSGISGKTDWVFSMPTRRYSVAQNYAWTSSTVSGGIDGRVFTNFDNAPAGAGQASLPFFALTNTSVGGTNGTQICVKGITQTSYDQSEAGVVASPTTASFSPPSATNPSAVLWCGETNVLSFNAASSTSASVLGATVARQNVLTSTGVDGWVSLGTAFAGSQLGGVYMNDATGNQIAPTGLPVVGSAYMQAFNPAASAGTSGTYGVRFAHRYTR